MVQTSQNISLLPTNRSAQAEHLLIQIHEVDSVDKMSKAVFNLIDVLFPTQFLILLFRPLEFELPCKFTPIKYKHVVDGYMSINHKEDLWLQRSPVNPQVSVVRHGDYTPVDLLHSSNYYKNVLQPLDSEFGASVVAWRHETWLATLTIMRNAAQGEFTDRHIDELKAFQPHFAGVIRRLAGDHESRLINSSFRRFMSKLTTATIVLDWNLKVVHANGAATQMCLRWERGDQAKSLKARRTFRLPPDLNRALDGLKSSISASTGEEKARVRQGQMVVANRKTPMFKALIEFLPSRSLALSKGTFLITFNEDSTGPNEIASRLQFLTPRERECAMLAASGMRNTEIAKQLGKSGITVRNQLTTVYRKLGVTSRLKLIAALGQSHHG